MYKHPGVCIEHIPSRMLSIETASTSIAAIVGRVKRGAIVGPNKPDKPGKRDEPEMIFDVGQFAEKFGPPGDTGGDIRDEGEQPDRFGFAVNAFFGNGGSKAYIVPVAKTDGSPATAAIVDPIFNTKGFYFAGSSAGTWADGPIVKLEPIDSTNLDLGYPIFIGNRLSREGIHALESACVRAADDNREIASITYVIVEQE